MFLRKSLCAVAGTILLSAGAGFGQQPQTQSQPAADETLRQERSERGERRQERLRLRQGMPEREGAGRQRPGLGHLMRELDLTEAQRQQGRAIMQRRLESTKVQREELAKLREKRAGGTLTAEEETRARALHQEIRSAMEGVREELAGVLTTEQKARLEQLKKERKQRIKERMKKRGDLLNANPQ
jgi:protein CpxP